MNNNDYPLSQGDIWSRLLCVRMILRDVIYVTYALPAKMLKPLVPNALQLATVGSDTAFISLVALRCNRVRLSAFPLFTFNYNQFNIRTYVIDPISEKSAVYFVRSGVTSRFISLTTNAIGIPWKYIKFTAAFSNSQGIRSSSISGDWEGHFAFKVEAEAKSPELPSFFVNWKSTVDFLVRPLIGFSGDGRRLVRFTIHHPEVQPESWSLVKLDHPLFNKLVRVDDIRKPHSVFYMPEAEFSIFMPPQRIKEKR